MPDFGQQKRIALGPGHDAYLMRSFTAAERALATTDRQATFETVPSRINGRWNHLESIVVVAEMDVDSDGTPTADLAAERLLASISNLRLSMLRGAHVLLPGGDVDLRVPHFLKAMRDGRIPSNLPADAGNASAADIFPNAWAVPITFAGSGQRPGRSRRDGLIPIAFFSDVRGQDSLRFDILAEAAAASIGAVAGVTVTDPFDSLEVWAITRSLPHLIVDALPSMRYVQTTDVSDYIRPIREDREAHLTEYCGFRQREEDTEGLTFASAGSLRLEHGDDASKPARTQAQIQNSRDAIDAAIVDRPIWQAAAAQDRRYMTGAGHLPFVYAGPQVDRDALGRTPVLYDITSFGASRVSARILQSEIHTWHDSEIVPAADAVGLTAAQFKDRLQEVRSIDVHPGLLPRRLVMP